MDYHSLPRRQLQVLCKKHGIPANAANSEMADALSTLLKPKPQPHTHKSKQPEKRATRSSEPALSETSSKNNDVEEGLNARPPKTTNTHKIPEQDLNREPQRSTRGRGSASTVSEAPKSATSKMAKTPTAGEMEINAATKQKETKKVCTRNGGSKQSVNEMPPNDKENVDAKISSPPDKKKEKSGGIVLRRGRVKVRSPRNLSKSPDTAQLTEEIAVRTIKNGVEMPSSQSCLVDARRTRKKKRSVTFADVIEISSVSIEHSTEVDASKEPAEETIAEIQQGLESDLPKNMNSASMAKKTISTRKASRSVSTKVIAAQAAHQKISKEPVAKVSKAKELHAFKAEKNASIEIGGESDRKRPVRGKKTAVDSVDETAAKENKKAVNFVGDAAAKENKKAVNSVGNAAAKENEEVGDVDGFVKCNLIDIEPAPCARRSRRLTIVPTDVRSNHNLQLATEQSMGQSKDDHEGVSFASKKSEGDLPAETSRRGRRKTLGPLELNHVQANVGSAPQQMEQKTSKAKVTQSNSRTYETKDEALESQQKQPDIKTCNSISVASEAGIQPIKSKEAPSARSLRGSRHKALVTCTYQPITSAEEVSIEMGYQKICSTGIISGNLMQNADTKESCDAHSEVAQSTSTLANSEPDSLREVLNEPDSLQEVLNDEKAKGETDKTTPVMPRSTNKTSNVSAQQHKETLVSQEPAFSQEKEAQQHKETLLSQEPAFNTQEKEGLKIFDEGEVKKMQDSEDLGVIVQADHEQSQVVLVLKSTNVPTIDDISPTGSTPSKEEINNHESFSCAFQVVINEATREQNQISEDADLISSMAAILSIAGDSKTASTSPLVDTHSVKPDVGTAAKDQEFTEEMSSATSPEHVPSSRHEFAIEKDEVLEQEYHALDDSAAIINSTNDIKDTLSHGSPVSRKIQDKGSPDGGNLHVHAITLENSIENYTDNSSSSSDTLESATEIFVGIATAEHKASTFEMRHLTSDTLKIGSMTSERAADLTEQQPNQVVELNLCEWDDAVDDDRNTGDEQLRQLSPILYLCSVEPRAATPMESACKMKQRRPRSIYKSARKAQFSVPWKNTSLEATTPLQSDKEASLDSLDQVEKNAEFWGLNNHGMTRDGEDSASSEDEGSSADTEETLSDTEVCNFKPEMLVPNAEGDYSCSEDDTPSDSDEDTMFDSDESFSEVDEELLSGDESDEQETSEEEFSESEDDEEDEFEEYEASPVSQPVAMYESIDAQYIIGGLEDRQADIIAASESSLSNDVVRMAEIENHVVLENATNGSVPNVEPTDNEGKFGTQHEEFSQHVVTEIQRNEDVMMAHNDGTSIERMQSATHDSESLASLSSLFASPPMKVQDEARCSLAPLGILESKISQQSGALETELTILPESVQETDVQSFSPCELSHEEGVAEVGHQTMDGAEHETELYELVDAAKKELKINGQMAELVQNCCVDELQNTSPTHAATKTQENCDVLMSYNDTTSMEAVQSPICSTYQDRDYLTSLSSLFARTPSDIIKEDAKCSLTPPSTSILESNFSQQSRVLETEVNISPESGEESLCFPCEVSQHNVVDQVEQHTMDGTKHYNDLCESEGGVDKEVEVEAHMIELIENCCVETSGASLPMLNYAEEFQILESNLKNALTSSKETEQVHSTATELPCLGPQEPTPENNEAEMGDSVICEEVIRNLNYVQKVQEEPGNLKIDGETLSYSVDEDEIKNDPGNNECSFGMVSDAQYSSEDLGEQLELAKGTSIEQLFSTEIATFGSLILAENDKSNEETAFEQDLQSLHFGDTIDELSQKHNTEDALKFDTAYIAIGTISSVASIEPAKEPLGFDVVTAKDEIHLLSSGTSCNLIEEGESLVQHECELNPLTSDASEQSETICMGEELEVVQSESNLEDLASQVVASDTFEVDLCSTPKQTSGSEIAWAFVHEISNEGAQILHCAEIDCIHAQVELVHEIPNEGAQTMQCADIDCIHAQVELVHQKSLDESQSSEESKEDKEQSETETIEEEPDFVQSESNVESLVSQVVANETSEKVELCGTPKQSDVSEFTSIFTHESPNKMAQTMHSAEIESMNAQVGKIHEKLLDEDQSSEECKEDEEFPATHDLVHEITKEQSLKQIDLTLVSVRKLRQMCKGNLMSAKKKEETENQKETENGTPAKMPSRPWMSATKQVHQPNTSIHQRDLPSANKRSALKALSSNIKAAPSAAMQTPTAKDSQRPQNPMSAYDGNDGTGKHLITPSPHAPMSSKRDFARSHHR